MFLGGPRHRLLFPSAYPPVRSRGGGAGGIGWRHGVIGVLGARGRKVPGAPWVRAERHLERQSPQPTRYALFPFLAMTIPSDLHRRLCPAVCPDRPTARDRRHPPMPPPPRCTFAGRPQLHGSPLSKARPPGNPLLISCRSIDLIFGRASQCLRGGSGAALHPAGHHIAHPHSLVHARRETGYRRGSRPE